MLYFCFIFKKINFVLLFKTNRSFLSLLYVIYSCQNLKLTRRNLFFVFYLFKIENHGFFERIFARCLIELGNDS